MDTEKQPDKIHKTRERNRRKFPQTDFLKKHIQKSHSKHTFPSQFRKKMGWPLLPLLFNILREVLGSSNESRKKIEEYLDLKEKNKTIFIYR